MDTELQEWLQPFTEGSTGGSSSVTDVSPADVEIPPPALPPSAHPHAKPASNKAGGKHNLFTHFVEDPNCEVCRRRKVTRAPCRRTRDDKLPKELAYPPLCTKRKATSGNNLKKNLQKKKKEVRGPSLDLEFRRDLWSVITYLYGIMLLKELNSLPNDDFPIPMLHGCSETNKNKHWCTSRGHHR